jgi:tetratricopeptide (TPR) repeat protein
MVQTLNVFFTCFGILLFIQVRGNSCVGKMNDLNEELSVLALRVEEILKLPALSEVEKGRAFLNKNKRKKAEQCWNRAIVLDSNCYQAYAFRAILFFQEGVLDKAGHDFELSTQAFGRKRAFFQQKYTGELTSIRDELRILKKRMNDISAGSLLIDGVGDAYNTKDKLFKIKSLEAKLDKMIDAGDTLSYPAAFRLFYGNLLFMRRMFEKAYSQYYLGLRQRPDSPPLNANMAAVLFTMNRKDEALTFYHRAIFLKADMKPRFKRDITAWEMNKNSE